MSNDKPTSTLDLFERNYRDARFRYIVEMLTAIMLEQKIAPDEIRDAAFLASIRYMHLMPVLRFVYERDDLPPQVQP